MNNLIKLLLVSFFTLGGVADSGNCQEVKVKDERVLNLLKEHEKQKRATVFEYEIFLEKLNAQLKTALKKEETKAISAGNLDWVQVIRADQKLIEAGSLPATDKPGTPQSIQRLRNVWRGEKMKLEKNKARAEADSNKAFLANLKKIEVALTQENNIDEALAVRKLRQNLPTSSGGATITNSIESGWINAFNGRDLQGWRVKGNPDYFEVKNGYLSESAPKGGTYLVYKGRGAKGEDIFVDFEFRAEARGPRDANSGLFFHLNSSIEGGVEVNIANGRNLANNTGSVWGLQNVKKEITGQESWFELLITVKGNTITVKKDGQTINVYEDKKGSLKSRGGRIAIQANSRQKNGFEFRKIELRRL